MFGNNAALALFIVRFVVGSVFILHGSQKVLGLFGGPGLQGFAQWLSTLGVPNIFAYLGALSEFIGGLMVLLGIATEMGALLLATDMAVAIYLVHLHSGYFSQNGGFEYPLNLILLCIALIIGGAWHRFISEFNRAAQKHCFLLL